MIRIASRASDLALWQANHVAERLRAANPGVAVEVQTFSTRGDREDEPALSALGGEGLFTAEVDRALLEEKADLAVHSLKDLPIETPPGLALVAIPARGPVEDALVSVGGLPLAKLPRGARVGTSSPRRAAFLAHERNDLEIVNLRGNVPTRVARVADGDLAATVLARAGLARLALADAVAETLGPPRLLPAPGQGALAITARAGDRRTAALVAPLGSPATHRAVEAERGVLAGLGGGCSIPLGVFAENHGDHEWRVSSMLFLEGGLSRLSDSRSGPDPDRLAEEAARELRRQGAPRMRTPNAERVRTIFAAATSLFGARPPETVTMEEIAAGAGVAKGTLYNYFESKDELLRELLATRLTEMIAGLEQTGSGDGPLESSGVGTGQRPAETPRDRLARIVRHLFRFQAGAPDFFWLLQRARGCAETRAVIRERETALIAILRRVLEEPGFAVPDCERGAVLVLGAVERAVARCLEAECRCDPDVEISELWAFLDRALGSGLPPLAGRTIVVTRDEPERGPLAEALRARGANVIHVPLVATEPTDGDALSNAARRLADYDWLVFTSARAVRAMAAAGRSNGAPPAAPSGTTARNGHRTRVAAVGSSTARAARDAGFAPDVVGSGGAEDLAGELEATLQADGGLRGASVLYPVSDRIRPEGVAAFESRGARVTAVQAYRTVPVEGAAERLAEILSRETVHAITFASPSAVEVFAAGNVPAKPALFALGATTARSLADHGFGQPPHPGRPGFDALAELVARALAELPED